MKLVVFVVFSLVSLSSLSISANAEWVLVAADSTNAYYFDSDSVVPVYPSVLVDLQVRSRATGKPLAALEALADCVQTEAVGFSRYVVFDKK